MLLQSEAKSRLAAQIAAKYDWRSPNRHATGDNRPKPSFLNTINQVNYPLTIFLTCWTEKAFIGVNYKIQL